MTDKEIAPWKREYDVQVTLRQMGHAMYRVGITSDLGLISAALELEQPDVVFNMLEEFDGQVLFDQHVVSSLEMKWARYTGCNPRGLTLARDKALSKKILAYHRILVPAFVVFYAGRKVRRPRAMSFPSLVKSLIDGGAVGVAQASVVHEEEGLAARVEVIHRQSGNAAIAEEYIAGREIYGSVLGNERLVTRCRGSCFYTTCRRARRASRRAS